MEASKVVRWSGPAAMLGGVLWAVWAVMVALTPEGCIGAECELPGSSSRDWGHLAPLFFASALLISVGFARIVLLARSAGRSGNMQRIGAIIVALGVVTVTTATLIQSIFFGGDFPLMPYFVIPSGLAIVIGFLLSGIAILRTGVLPRWAAALLITATMVMLGVNEQNKRILMAIPFGIAWIAVGYTLRSARDRAPAVQTS